MNQLTSFFAPDTRARVTMMAPAAIGCVLAMAEDAMHMNFEIIERRLAVRPWWSGDSWSIMDAYLDWVWFRVTGTRFDASRGLSINSDGPGAVTTPSRAIYGGVATK